MKAYDFEYDGLRLSDMGFMICTFGNGKSKAVSNGSHISFNTVSTLNGRKFELTSFEYDNYLTATFYICKNPCVSDAQEISLEESRKIMNWLNRGRFHKFKLLDLEYVNIYFEASFNINKVEFDGKIYGFELEMVTNRPFAIQEPVIVVFKNIVANSQRKIVSQSDEEGFIYPNMEITIEDSGDFELYNVTEERRMRIANCEAGEVIKIGYPIITTSNPSHKIQNDFNWEFFRIVNSFKNKENDIVFSLPCTVRIEYTPIVKVSV